MNHFYGCIFLIFNYKLRQKLEIYLKLKIDIILFSKKIEKLRVNYLKLL